MARHGKMFFIVRGMGKPEGADIRQFTAFDDESQKFVALATEEGTYKLISLLNGMVVTAAGSHQEATAQLNSNKDQGLAKWRFLKTRSREGNGDGLKGEYFSGMNFTSKWFERTDAQIDFNWGLSNPGGNLPDDNYSVRWTGFIEPRYSEDYTFTIISDNGRRLWIDDQLIIDEWVSDWDTPYSGSITLVAGEKHTIVIDYFEDAGGASIKLEWESNHESKEIVPQSQLYSGEALSIGPLSISLPITIYPNPAVNVLYVKGAEESDQLEIYNLQGEKLLQGYGSEINIETLTSGLYIVCVKNEGGILSVKFVKE